MNKFKHTQSGFSLMEVMIAIAILVIIATLSVPSINAMFARNDVTAAQQDIAQSLRKAKQFARSVNTAITVTFTLNGSDNSISFTLPDGSNTLPDGIRMNTVTLPNQVAVTSDNSAYTFNSLGIIDTIGTITVASSRDGSQIKSVALLNLLGQIQVD